MMMCMAQCALSRSVSSNNLSLTCYFYLLAESQAGSFKITAMLITSENCLIVKIKQNLV